MNDQELREFILDVVRSDVAHRRFSCEKHKKDPEACVGLHQAEKALAYLLRLWQESDK